MQIINRPEHGRFGLVLLPYVKLESIVDSYPGCMFDLACCVTIREGRLVNRDRVVLSVSTRICHEHVGIFRSITMFMSVVSSGVSYIAI